MKKRPFFMDEPLWLRLLMWAGLSGLLYHLFFVFFHEYDQRGPLEKWSSVLGYFTIAFYLSREWYLEHYKKKA
jgi:hypothetical protein